MTGWKDIATAPTGCDILVCQAQNGIIRVARGRTTEGNWRTGPGPMDYIAAVTHWYDFGDGKPMPDAPEVE